MRRNDAQQQAFDHFRASTFEVVTAPPIAERLGELAHQIVTLLDGAYMPEVRKCRLVVPPNQIGANEVAVFPVVPGMKAVDHHPFLATPPPGHEPADLPPRPARDVLRHKNLLHEGIMPIDPRLSTAGKVDLAAVVSDKYLLHRDLESGHFGQRRLIMTSSEVHSGSLLQTGSTGAHELGHILAMDELAEHRPTPQTSELDAARFNTALERLEYDRNTAAIARVALDIPEFFQPTPVAITLLGLTPGEAGEAAVRLGGAHRATLGREISDDEALTVSAGFTAHIAIALSKVFRDDLPNGMPGDAETLAYASAGLIGYKPQPGQAYDPALVPPAPDWAKPKW